ncbi:hypothetical protein FMUND_955 [Fusarium mundagurra]|uniref:Uncharacterized protein n=1 Tax=Fusarium mundagurra TaxID=1567541 RepID=A0A8H5Z5K4_9HYPO|nr:hypothetical protein FMUND_955 [Fusarium mundagurra]
MTLSSDQSLDSQIVFLHSYQEGVKRIGWEKVQGCPCNRVIGFAKVREHEYLMMAEQGVPGAAGGTPTPLVNVRLSQAPHQLQRVIPYHQTTKSSPLQTNTHHSERRWSRGTSNVPSFRNLHNNRSRSQYLEKKMAKAKAVRKQLHFRCESNMPHILPGESALAADPLENPIVAPAMDFSLQAGLATVRLSSRQSIISLVVSTTTSEGI